MQAQGTALGGMKRYALSHVGGTILAAAIVVTGIGAMVAASTSLDVPGIGDNDGSIAAPVAVQPQAYNHPEMGEGLVGPSTANMDVPKSYYVPGAGDGLVGPQLGSVAPDASGVGQITMDDYIASGFDPTFFPSTLPEVSASLNAPKASAPAAGNYLASGQDLAFHVIAGGQVLSSAQLAFLEDNIYLPGYARDLPPALEDGIHRPGYTNY